MGIGKNPHNGELSPFNKVKWKFLMESPYRFSNQCCNVMKKSPAHNYQHRTGKKAMTAQMACESRMRTSTWIKHGCNAFDSKIPVSNPMSFWTEQDVLLYIKLYGKDMVQARIENLESKYGCPLEEIIDSETGKPKYNREDMTPICSVYGDIVAEEKGELAGQETWSTLGIFDTGMPTLTTTGCKRTGCMFCGYGCHLEKGEGRFEMMKRTHTKQYEWIMKPWDKGGLGYKDVIDWLNENGNLHIKY